MKIRTILQDFEWNLPADAQHWNRVAGQAESLAELGFTDVWLPPAYKGLSGKDDVGYGVYDLYDLGEFPAKGSVPTKYGTVGQYMDAIATLHNAGLNVLADIVLNHKMGADRTEWVKAHVYRRDQRINGYVKTKKITAATKFKFPERNCRYSNFKWCHDHFTGIDFNKDNERGATKFNGGYKFVYKFFGHRWSENVDFEKENFDYLMGCDLDFKNPAVVAELKRWGKWYINRTGIDGVRLDALKHIDFNFYPEWLGAMREHIRENGYPSDFLAVGEYWSGNSQALVDYLHNCGSCMHLFDVALHYNLWNASNLGSAYDLRKILDDTLVARDPWHAVTFVDNHDTQPSEALRSWVQNWFKQSAYALVLLRQSGIPCVFYGDMYGVNECAKDGKYYPPIPAVRDIEKLLEARKSYATGEQQDYFEKKNLIGWTREGGAAVVISNAGEDAIRMKHGEPGQVFVDMLGNSKKEVVVDEDGFGWFGTPGGSVSVWVPKD